MKNIFITGGAGYIGSYCIVFLSENGYRPIILDNFSNCHPNVIKKLELITKKNYFLQNRY
jgi:UDP-glucose 4-epimerase